MITHDRKTRPSAAPYPAPGPVPQNPVKTSPENPLWLQLATRSNANVAASPETPEHSHRDSEPSVPLSSMLPLVQRKPSISSPSDPYERDADEVADKVMRMAEPAPISSVPVAVRRKCAECDDENEILIQRVHAPSTNVEGEMDTEAAIRAAKHDGERLPPALRSYFEPRFGHDFSRVRLHTGREAADAARAVQARAYTVGRDVVFGDQQYDPHSAKGQRLIAHELAHVVQQDTGGETARAFAESRFGFDFSRPAGDGRLLAHSGVGPLIQRKDEADPASGELDVQPEPPKEEMDAFLASRVDLFRVNVVGDVYVVKVDRKENPWTERYTPRAIAFGAIAALIRKLGENPPSPMAIRDIIDEVLESSGRQFELRVPAAIGPVAVERFWSVIVDRPVVAELTERIGLTLSTEGWKLQRGVETGSFLNEALKQVAQNFGSVRPYLPADVLEKAQISERHVFNMLTTDKTRRVASELIKTHRLVRPLIKGRDLAASAGESDVRPDWKGLTPDTWAKLVAELAADIVRAVGAAALERQERKRQHQLNEYLRPYQLEIPLTEVVSFILNTYDPESTVTVNLLGPVNVEGGQRIINAKGETLFILKASSQVIYQNLSDLKFYRQSAAGIEQELQYGVFALVAEKTKHLIPLTKFMFRVLGVIFPPVGAMMTATTVLNVAGNVMQYQGELEAAYDNLRIIQRNMEILVPGITDAVLELVANNVDAALLILLDPEYAEVAWDEWLVVVLEYAITAVGGGAADVAGKAAVGLLEKAWAIIKKAITTLITTLKLAYKLGRPVAVGAGRGSADWDLKRVRKAAAKLEGIGLVDALSLAERLLSLDEEQVDQLLDEMDELDRVGTNLISTVTKIVAW